jgi:anti-sigma factor ChrR (cupin superfamily)
LTLISVRKAPAALIIRHNQQIALPALQYDQFHENKSWLFPGLSALPLPGLFVAVF